MDSIVHRITGRCRNAPLVLVALVGAVGATYTVIRLAPTQRTLRVAISSAAAGGALVLVSSVPPRRFDSAVALALSWMVALRCVGIAAQAPAIGDGTNGDEVDIPLVPFLKAFTIFVVPAIRRRGASPAAPNLLCGVPVTSKMSKAAVHDNQPEDSPTEGSTSGSVRAALPPVMSGAWSLAVASTMVWFFTRYDDAGGGIGGLLQTAGDVTDVANHLTTWATGRRSTAQARTAGEGDSPLVPPAHDAKRRLLSLVRLCNAHPGIVTQVLAAAFNLCVRAPVAAFTPYEVLPLAEWPFLRPSAAITVSDLRSVGARATRAGVKSPSAVGVLVHDAVFRPLVSAGAPTAAAALASFVVSAGMQAHVALVHMGADGETPGTMPADPLTRAVSATAFFLLHDLAMAVPQAHRGPLAKVPQWVRSLAVRAALVVVVGRLMAPVHLGASDVLLSAGATLCNHVVDGLVGASADRP
eukprot:TRINITY_DN47261_c0_g1_i1.p1 TRINITY_DN47261_c0_g1~~TRINITY_DN47261_c0_g1_i1.p1  ORF type:complete len:480 (+),score=52.62 TRINITY_DN47261_c0_g1_i1:35-1441(+)